MGVNSWCTLVTLGLVLLVHKQADSAATAPAVLSSSNSTEEDLWYDDGGYAEEQLPQSAALVDASTADQGKHPWHVGLVREESKTGFLGWVRHLGGLIRTTTFCGATLVSTRWLVTAAHCIKPTDRPVDMRVVMGSSKRARYFYYFFQTDSVDQIHVHPRHNPDNHEFDIALLRLKKLPSLSPGELWPVCLPTDRLATYDGRTATVVGWGRTEGKAGGSAPRYLQELQVSVISQQQCQRQWAHGKGRVEVGGPKMCFESSGSACHGDSGGGMFIRERNKETLIGVCSYGLADCQNWAPEVYTRVNSALDWIVGTIQGDNSGDINMAECGLTVSSGSAGRSARDFAEDTEDRPPSLGIGSTWQEWWGVASHLWKLTVQGSS